jgi:hypothetical protein
MPVTLETSSTSASLRDQETAIRRREELGFRLLSLAIGAVDGRPGNLVTFRQTLGGPPAAEITLRLVDGTLPLADQEGLLNTAGAEVVCYGALHVEGTPRNVGAFR